MSVPLIAVLYGFIITVNLITATFFVGLGIKSMSIRSVSVHLRYGVAHIFVRGEESSRWMVMAPWNKPLFSERNGCHITMFSLWGWRILERSKSSV